MSEKEIIRLSPTAHSVLTRHVCGSYSHTDWAVVDGAGQRCEDGVIDEGRFIVVENAYDATILWITKDPNNPNNLILTQCKVEY